MRKADYKVSAKPVRINGFCSICKKETNNGYCYVHPYGHREYLICPNCLMYVVADRERCYKYHPLVPDVVPKRSACRQGDLAKV